MGAPVRELHEVYPFVAKTGKYFYLPTKSWLARNNNNNNNKT